MQVADGKTQVRRAGAPWEEAAGLVEGFAPQGDFMAFLKAATTIEVHGPETRQGVFFTRYTFQIDGPAFARYTRDQMQRTMQAKGELPSGMELAVSPAYEGMSGSGELWIGADGLPLRQILNLTFPPQRDEQIFAQISTTFSDFAPANPWAFITDPARLAAAATAAGKLALALTVAGCVALVAFRRQRLVETVLAVLLSLLMVVGPMLRVKMSAGALTTSCASSALCWTFRTWIAPWLP